MADLIANYNLLLTHLTFAVEYFSKSSQKLLDNLLFFFFQTAAPLYNSKELSACSFPIQVEISAHAYVLF